MGGHGQLGLGSTDWRWEPYQVSKLSKLTITAVRLLPLRRRVFCADVCFALRVQISAGSYQTTFLTNKNRVYICGSYLLGAQGIGSSHRVLNEPYVVGKLLGLNIRRVAVGNHFVAAIERQSRSLPSNKMPATVAATASDVIVNVHTAPAGKYVTEEPDQDGNDGNQRERAVEVLSPVENIVPGAIDN